MKNPSVHGDLYVTVQIQVPRNLNPGVNRNCGNSSGHAVEIDLYAGLSLICRNFVNHEGIRLILFLRSCAIIL